MIYFVDEDEIQLEPYKIELEILGYSVDVIPEAEEAFSLLSTLRIEPEIVIIDVMLAPGVTHPAMKFDRMKTRDYLETGLCLLDDLVEANPRFFPSKAILFSTATSQSLVGAIQNAAVRNGVRYLDKHKYDSAFEFGKVVDAHIKSMSETHFEEAKP